MKSTLAKTIAVVVIIGSFVVLLWAFQPEELALPETGETEILDEEGPNTLAAIQNAETAPELLAHETDREADILRRRKEWLDERPEIAQDESGWTLMPKNDYEHYVTRAQNRDAEAALLAYVLTRVCLTSARNEVEHQAEIGRLYSDGVIRYALESGHETDIERENTARTREILHCRYERCRDVPKDLGVGRYWLTEAARLGDPRARYFVTTHSETRPDVPTMIMYLEDAGIKGGQPTALYRLAGIYEDEAGYLNPKLAYAYYEAARKAGVPMDQELKRVHAKLRYEDVPEAEELATRIHDECCKNKPVGPLGDGYSVIPPFENVCIAQSKVIFSQ